MDPYGGGQQQMMSMSMSSVCACVVLAAGGLLFWSQTNKPQPTSAPPVYTPLPTTTDTTSPPSSGPLTEGMYNVASGGVSMIVNPENCTDSRVGFNDPQENDKHAWNFKPVPGRPGYYYVQSEHRLFKKGCSNAYLTAPSDCNASPELDEPRWADRQYWELLPTGSAGEYQLKNAACASKRAPSYLTSSGVNKGWSTFKMTDRSGTRYKMTPWA